MSEAGRLYQRASLMLLVFPLLGTILVTVGRLDILSVCFVRVDAFMFYLFFAVGMCALVTGLVFLFLCVYPRQYKTLANMDVWKNWRDDYRKYLEEKDEPAEAERACALDAAMLANLCPRLAEAQPINAEINERRRKAFKRSIQMGAVALGAVGVQALFAVILRIQGV
jgi:hypothetical protein